jgi:hypothetical protein
MKRSTKNKGNNFQLIGSVRERTVQIRLPRLVSLLFTVLNKGNAQQDLTRAGL